MRVRQDGGQDDQHRRACDENRQHESQCGEMVKKRGVEYKQDQAWILLQWIFELSQSFMIDGGGKWIKVELVQSGSRLQVTTLQRHQIITNES